MKKSGQKKEGDKKQKIAVKINNFQNSCGDVML